jgi:NAD(P)-dependent dehydrogenase (short-subunit alcohol dehydrogenase family)
MVKGKSGLIVEVVEQPGIGYHGQFFFDMLETMLKRLAYGLAAEVAPHKVTALAVTPGFMRTEATLEGFGVNRSELARRPRSSQGEELRLGGI